ncbi:rod shape-determining protein RodA [Alkaliphilus pronyensis]|uniref:Peptidoglycan glycosyltransferase RodA n=1 Tax=Alkaliphilus pronyensis TaxID=1482732 RepID=A0A6I0F075_9FIRM|nr:rod shape-determining protein RodA [Alkaliphilus pronyensis]KAB3535307.1 rod shape-determining protein RodA [Alkaliphilus pronyensis]
MKLEGRLIKKIDYTIIIIVLLICSLGVLMIGSATHTYVGGSEGFIKTQITSIILGLIAIAIILLIDYNSVARFWVPIYIACNGLLLAVLLFGSGKETWGANRWIRIAGRQFQPADFVKIGIIICLAKIISDNKDRINEPLVLLKIFAYAGLPMVLIYLQPDLGTTMAFAFFTFGMIFIAGLRFKYIIGTILTGVICFPIMWFTGLLKPYHKNRIMVFLNPELDPSDTGYQILQSKLAVGSGMFWGKGLYNGSQTQYGFLPEKHNDFIFSVIAEELGFIGVTALIALYGFLLKRFISIARDAKDDFGAFLVIGNTFMLAFHIFANIAMTIGLMPVTGKPLPFISYGGTFMLTNMIAVGIILNVNMRRDKINF